jgi:N-acetylmuramoyl-L-alanine amidase
MRDKLKNLLFFTYMLTFLSGANFQLFASYIDDSHPSENFNQRVKYLVIHCIGLSEEETLKTLTKSGEHGGGGVSAHWLVPSKKPSGVEKFPLYSLVKEEDRAWHAGESYWRRDANINGISIGVEFHSPGYGVGGDIYNFGTFSEEQILAGFQLLKDIRERYQISPENVVYHSDIAPARKTDPGINFPGKRLHYEYGVGMWPDQAYNSSIGGPSSTRAVTELLKKIGYKIEPSEELDASSCKVVSAFQLHYRPQDYSGDIDAETGFIAAQLVKQYNL